jgi:hypothetical protein
MRKSFLGGKPQRPELDRLLEATKNMPVSDAELREQRISFAYGNAPVDATGITKDSVRAASESIRLRG